jgi:hypothetical protein
MQEDETRKMGADHFAVWGRDNEEMHVSADKRGGSQSSAGRGDGPIWACLQGHGVGESCPSWGKLAGSTSQSSAVK